MKKIFQSFDGEIFESEQDAIDHEAHCKDSVFVIVDDDPGIRNVLIMTLKRAKIRHEIFEDPLEAMNYISKNKVTHVFTDYHMRSFGMSGKWIKEICGQYNVGCSIVSGDETVADISKIEFVTDCIPYMKHKTKT